MTVLPSWFRLVKLFGNSETYFLTQAIEWFNFKWWKLRQSNQYFKLELFIVDTKILYFLIRTILVFGKKFFFEFHVLLGKCISVLYGKGTVDQFDSWKGRHDRETRDFYGEARNVQSAASFKGMNSPVTYIWKISSRVLIETPQQRSIHRTWELPQLSVGSF